MKNYRSIVAIGLVVLMAISIYYMISTSMSKAKQIELLVQDAQTLSEQGLIGKAVEKYSEAITINPTIEYYNAVTDLYYEAGELENSISWGEKTIKLFPEEVSGYERLLRAYIDYKKYSAAFETLEVIDGRNLKSDRISEFRSEIEYLFYLEYVAIDELRQPSGSYVTVLQGEKWGVMTTTGKSVVKSQYVSVGDFANGVVPACGSDGVWYFIDADGQYVANISYGISGAIESVGLYNEGLFPVNNGTYYTYYDMDFQRHLDEYDYAGAFNLGVAAVKQGDNWFLINSDGERITNEEFDEIIVDARGVCCMQNRVMVKKADKCYMLDTSGNRIGTSEFEDAKAPSNGEMIAVKQNGKWGFADLDGNLQISAQYSDALSFSNDLAAVCIDGFWGYIDTENNLRIAPEYIGCYNIGSNGAALVKTDRGWNILKLYSKNY